MDIRSATGSAGAASDPRTVARESSTSAAARPATSASTAPDPALDTPAEAQQSSASGQFYVSPFLTFDSRSLTVIFQVRDTESGDVTRQFPAESVVERYRRDPSSRPFVLPEPEPRGEEQAGPPPPTIGGPVTEALREQDGADAAPTGAPTSDAGGSPEPAAADPRPAQPAPPAIAPNGRTSIDLVA